LFACDDRITNVIDVASHHYAAFLNRLGHPNNLMIDYQAHDSLGDSAHIRAGKFSKVYSFQKPEPCPLLAADLPRLRFAIAGQ
jgi:hypothetical protein